MMKTLSWVEDIIGNDPTEPRIDTNKHK